MKFKLVAAGMLLIASCAPSQPYRPAPASFPGNADRGTTRGTSSGGVTSEIKPPNNYGQDAVECERKAALSQVGSKGEAFANCMRSRGHSPGR
jgi:hypothetical protein